MDLSDISMNPLEGKIIRYVNDNPGCSKSDIVRYLESENLASRITTLTHIDKLDRRRMLIFELEKPNSQVYKIYINKIGIVSLLQTEIETLERRLRRLRKIIEEFDSMIAPEKNKGK